MARKSKKDKELDGWRKLEADENGSYLPEIESIIIDANKKKKPSKKQPTTKELKKQILTEEKHKLEKAAEKIALKTMTELQLATQVELSSEQEQAAKMIASGYSYDEVAESLSRKKQEVVAWMAQPSFARSVNELTIKEGLSDKNERVRGAKRIAQELQDAILAKILDDGLENMSVGVLSDLLLKWSARVDTLVDKKEETTKKDLTVLILNHVQETNGKKYNKLEDFLSDDDFKFPTLEAEVIKDE